MRPLSALACSAEEALDSLDHRSVAKLACAFHSMGVHHPQAAKVLSDTTTLLLTQQLQVGTHHSRSDQQYSSDQKS